MPPAPPRYAAIDIGSNAARLLVARPAAVGGALKKEMFSRMPVRLGGDVFSDGKIHPPTLDALLHTLRGFAELIRAAAPAAHRCVATSALREADNRDEVISLAAAAGVAVELLSGEEEARLAAVGKNRKGDFLSADIGGGSTDIAVFRGGEITELQSFCLGTLRDFSASKEEKRRLRQWLAAQKKGTKINASGGGINRVAKILSAANGQNLKLKPLAALLAEVEKLTPPQRAEKYNLRPDRADTIDNLLRIALEILSASGAEEIRAERSGLADGIVYDLHARQRRGG